MKRDSTCGRRGAGVFSGLAAHATRVAALVIVPALLTLSSRGAEKSPATYARTPEVLVPYRDIGPPYRWFFQDRLDFRGPGQDAADPPGLTEVRIGVLVPTEGTADWTAGQHMRRGAELAVADANAAGGYRGLPFRLLVHADLPIWGASANEVVRMVFDDKVWAMIGSVGDDSTHIASRVALKTEIPLLNTASLDPTITEHNIPWTFRCIPDARQQCYALAQLIFGELRLRRIAVLRSTDRSSRVGIGELRDAARRLGFPFVSEIQWFPETTDFAGLIQRIRWSTPDAIVIWGPAKRAATALREIRAAGLRQPCFGPSMLLEDAFLNTAGFAAEGLTVCATFDPAAGNSALRAFREKYRQAYGEEPDAYAAYAFDGTALLLERIRKAGLNRSRIRETLASSEEWRGVTGSIRFDSTRNNVRSIFLATYHDGKPVYRPAPEGLLKRP